MAETEIIRSNRDKVAARLREKHPGAEYADDEALWGQVSDDYDGYDGELAELRGREKELSDLYLRDPRSASFLMKWREGGDPAVELVRMYGDNFVEEMRDPDKAEEFAAAAKEYMDRVASERDFEEQYERNVSDTVALLDEMRDKDGRTEEELDRAMEFLAGVMRDGVVGKFTRETLEMGLRAVNHADDVAAARRDGEAAGRAEGMAAGTVKGRNERIEMNRRGGDGVPVLGGGPGGGRQAPAPGDYGALGRGGSSTIWERGGERRTRRG